jgi:membrane protein
LILTIDRQLNNIWRVRTTRHLARRIIVYWTLLTLGPLLLGLSLTFSSYVLSASKGWVSVLPGGVKVLLDVLEFVVIATGLAAMYRFVPNTQVRWTHALLGGVFTATGLELAKKVLAWYLAQVPTISAVYGAFATVPILLIWIYVAWVIVLLGAVVAAYLPSLQSGIERRGDTPGWNFQLALEILQSLAKNGSGKNLDTLSKELRVDDLQLESPLQTLIGLDWLGKLDEDHHHQDGQGRGGRYVLLVNPSTTLLVPLSERLLLPKEAATQKLWGRSQLSAVYLSEVL